MSVVGDWGGTVILTTLLFWFVTGRIRTMRQYERDLDSAREQMQWVRGAGDLVARHLDALAGELPQAPAPMPDPTRDRHVAFPDREEDA